MRLADIVEDCLRLLHAARREQGPAGGRSSSTRACEQIWADERAIRQICLNLMSNALKFTPARRPHHAQRRRHARRRPDADRQGHRARHPQGGDPAASCRPSARARWRTRRPKAAPASACRSCRTWSTLHGGTFELRSELRKGTEAVVMLPGSRVLRAMPPLQPLGQETPPPAAGAPRGASRGRRGCGAETADDGAQSTAVALSAHCQRPPASYIRWAGAACGCSSRAARAEADAKPPASRSA